MRVRALAVALAIGASASAAAAETRWLPAGARAIPRARSASRDAPVLEYAYGPRSMASVGLEPGLLLVRGETTSWRLGVSALLAGESATNGDLTPGELWRDVEALSAALAFDELGRRLLGGRLELTLAVGHEAAHRSDTEQPLEAWRPTDIPFGGGGWFFAPDLAAAIPTARFELVARVQNRFFTNAFPMLIGAREPSDYVADSLSEGLAHQPSAELIFAWSLSDTVKPVTALHGEALIPHDDSAKAGVLARFLAGLHLQGSAGMLMPFVAVSAGNGKGELINRQELGLSVGVRHAP